MSNRKKSWAISISIHIIFCFILFSIKIQYTKKIEKNPLEFTYISPQVEELKKELEKKGKISPKKTTPKITGTTLPEISGIILPERRIPKYVPKELTPLLITPMDSIRLWEKGIRRYFKEKEIIPFAGNKYEFLEYNHNEKYKKALEQDSLKMLEKILAANLEKIVLSGDELKNLPMFPNPADEWLFRKQGGSRVLPILPLISEGIKLAQTALKKIFFDENPAHANLFLNDIEIQILNIIWLKRVVTPTSLYNSLSGTLNLKLSSVANILVELESKKILISKKGFKEYLYTPVVSKKDVFEYYIRNLIELEESERKNLPIRKDLKDSILDKIKLLNLADD